MKPKMNMVRSNNRSERAAQTANRIPVTECNYQSVMLDGFRGGCAKAIAPSFRSISAGYFRSEARHAFVEEAAFFAMIVITSALPIVSNMHALAQFVRAIGV
jgi:hypothetical protein